MTLLELLDDRVARYADKVAFRFLGADGAEEEQLTYAELRRQALATAAQLQEELPPAATVLVALPTSRAAVVLFLGALHAGALPVMLPAPGHPKDRRSLTHLRHVAGMTDASVLYITAEG